MTFRTALAKRRILFGIAAYAAEIVFVGNIASLPEGWYIEHLSWHWIFRKAAIVTAMMACVYYGIPRRAATATRPISRRYWGGIQAARMKPSAVASVYACARTC